MDKTPWRVSVPIMGGKNRLVVSWRLGSPIFRVWGTESCVSQDCRRSELNEGKRRIYEWEPLFEEERLPMTRALASGPLLGKQEFVLRARVQTWEPRFRRCH